MKVLLTLLASVIFLLPAVSASGEPSSFEIPALASPVMDQAGIMSPAGRSRTETLLRSLFESGGSQITVLTTGSLAGLSIEEASIKVVDQWKLGRQDKDDGILLLVAPNDRRVRIEVGRGKEGDLPDAWARRIISQVISPLFREGRFDDGIYMGVAAIIQRTDPQFDLDAAGAPSPRVRSRQASGGSPLLAFLFILFFILIGPLVTFLRMLGVLPPQSVMRTHRRSGWGHGGYGSFGGRGGFGGGGGWSGGGGGFSGGGSSGSW